MNLTFVHVHYTQEMPALTEAEILGVIRRQAYAQGNPAHGPAHTRPVWTSMGIPAVYIHTATRTMNKGAHSYRLRVGGATVTITRVPFAYGHGRAGPDAEDERARRCTYLYRLLLGAPALGHH